MKQSELMTTGESLSPRNAWLKRHMLVLVAEDPAIVGQTIPKTDETAHAFYCLRDITASGEQAWAKIGRGGSEEIACVDFAMRNGLKTWIEGGAL